MNPSGDAFSSRNSSLQRAACLKIPKNLPIRSSDLTLCNPSLFRDIAPIASGIVKSSSADLPKSPSNSSKNALMKPASLRMAYAVGSLLMIPVMMLIVSSRLSNAKSTSYARRSVMIVNPLLAMKLSRMSGNDFRKRSINCNGPDLVILKEFLSGKNSRRMPINPAVRR
ncbi:hypothetical protein OGAPHI_005939 [Ogataea philodendri]|uniref:Uncharacterized protein n=1 Tax=Ogataea philodendri TaxID=1378263 RepID=A0A9P8T1J8_9ASCO|nr:uncharacterized protein OGAPHI_005939 [Ogataea philodendri]KAH3661761.1 hypothetical protein OGAPHI_005939 [Ogataea philodendri]